jgi:hypothetical protein
MKIGLIVECGPQGADQQVCEYLIGRIAEETQTPLTCSCRTMDNKPGLVANCGEVAALLLNEGCERIVIVWDLYPAWSEEGKRPCRHNDKESIIASLNEANVALERVVMVCIESMMESWLLTDGRALSAFLSKPHRPITISDNNQAHRNRKPKGTLTDYMQPAGFGRYQDYLHAIRIIEKLPDLKRLRKCKSFARFEAKILD